MLHVLVKTDDMGMRKAWYIGSVVRSISIIDHTFAIVVFKNNDNYTFREVGIERVHLDTSYRNETLPVPENSLREINLKLKGSKK